MDSTVSKQTFFWCCQTDRRQPMEAEFSDTTACSQFLPLCFVACFSFCRITFFVYSVSLKFSFRST